MKHITILACLFTALLLCLLSSFCTAEEAEQETYTSGDFTYVRLDNNTAEITKYQGKAETLEVPNELDGYVVTALGNDAFFSCSSLTSITLPDSVTSIGDEAFSFCHDLVSISLPNTVTTIGMNPFQGCENLTRILVSPNHPVLATINGVLFCKSDKRLVCYPCAFTQPEFTVPQGIGIIGDQAFYECSGLTSVILPDGVTSIGTDAFSSCSGLTSITFPDSVNAIGDHAFYKCSGLTSITLPDSVTTIGKNPFQFCENLAKILVSPDHPALATIDGVLFSKSDKRLVCYPLALTHSEYMVPQGIDIIGNRAFSGCDLTSITLPDSVTAIDDGAFSSCYSLTSITLPDSVTTIGNQAFSNCNGLGSITLPDGVTTIGNWAFSYCTGLTSITLPDSVTTIGDMTFCGCDGLVSITLSDSVTTIGSGAFASCSGLTSITLPDSVTAIGARAFAGCRSLTITVGRDSYAKQYCIDNGLSYTYPDANDWLNG